MGRDRLGIIYFSFLVWEPTQKPTKKDAMRQRELQTPTLCFLKPCSIKLGYKIELCPLSGLNQGPSNLQSDALPTELHGRTLAETLRCAPFFFFIFFFFVAATKTKVRRLRLPGIEPGSNAWEASMITITLQALNTPGGDRTRDPRLIRPVLCL